jgi:CMP-N,N'-diacetyllegionaminic acid synthase
MIIAFIPARSGSERIENKNILQINGKPLIHYTIETAIESGIFDRVVVSTDSEKYAKIAKQIDNVEVVIRPAGISGSTSPDIQWVKHAINSLSLDNSDIFSILRPTSPFRTKSVIQEAVEKFLNNKSGCDSLRAVAKCEVHPGKMWVKQGDFISPLLPYFVDGTPWHSSQKKSLPIIHYQTGSLEIANVSTVTQKGSISGERVLAFEVDGRNAFDINEPSDLEGMERYL